METVARDDPTMQAAPGGTGLLAAALARAQAKFPAVVKDQRVKIDSAKGGYSYTYAGLAEVLDAVRGPLAAEELALVHVLDWDDGHPWLIGRLLHSSGQSIQSRYPLSSYDRPQDFGSAITYGRRYTTYGLTGIAPEEDDDGAAAQEAEPRKPRAPVGPKLTCPRCGKADSTAKSQYGHDQSWYCFRCKKGFDAAGPVVEREPGADEGAEALSNKASIPKPGTKGRSDPAALAAECRRVTGDNDAARSLYHELVGDLAGPTPSAAQVLAGWLALEKHPIFGGGK